MYRNVDITGLKTLDTGLLTARLRGEFCECASAFDAMLDAEQVSFLFYPEKESSVKQLVLYGWLCSMCVRMIKPIHNSRAV